MKRSRDIFLILLLLSTSLLFSCYGNSKIDEDGVFKCDTKSDCIEGFECIADPTKQGEKFCKRATVSANDDTCIDHDGDGYGDPGTSDNGFRTCPACTLDNTRCSRKTAEDCDPNNKKVNPGSVEICNGIDDNCNGDIDEAPNKTCGSYRDCVVKIPGYGNIVGDCYKGKCVLKQDSSNTAPCVQCKKNGDKFEYLPAASCD